MALRFTPIASESLGVRSMSVFLETPDVRMVLDGGVSLGPRFGLPPHPFEYTALRRARQLIRKYASKSEAVTITHYHFDHYTATWKSVEAKWTWSSYDEAKAIYGGRIIYAKSFRNSINPSQRRRGYIFDKIARDFVKEIRSADSETIHFDDTAITFSQPLPHGEEGTPLGYVLLINVKYGEESLLFCPDVQGPLVDVTLNHILEMKPSVLVIGGPPLYLVDYKVTRASLTRAMRNLHLIAANVPYILLDHHILRSEEGLAEMQKLKVAADSRGHMVKTFAEHLGLENRLLEARRQLLFKEAPPPEEFQRWMKLPFLQQRLQLPPV